MHNTLTIFRKEIASFFNGLVGYIVLAVFLTMVGLFFWVFDEHVLVSGQANMNLLFQFAPWFFLFLIPAVTMRSFSEEIKSGTIESLVTKPVTDWQIIAGKFGAAAFVVLIALLPTMIYWISIDALAFDPSELQGVTNSELLNQSGGIGYASKLDNGPIIGAYIGLFALGAIFAALGILSSAITDNQVVAFVLGAFLCFFFYYGFQFLADLEALQNVNLAVAGLGIYAHFESISLGVVDTRDIVYFISAILLVLLATRLILTYKRR